MKVYWDLGFIGLQFNTLLVFYIPIFHFEVTSESCAHRLQSKLKLSAEGCSPPLLGCAAHLACSQYMGVSMAMGVPQNRWFLLGKIPFKWMMTGGTLISGNLHILSTGISLPSKLRTNVQGQSRVISQPERQQEQLVCGSSVNSVCESPKKEWQEIQRRVVVQVKYMRGSIVMGLPLVIIHFERWDLWDFPLQTNPLELPPWPWKPPYGVKQASCCGHSPCFGPMKGAHQNPNPSRSDFLQISCGF